jgi:hypothetical protein
MGVSNENVSFGNTGLVGLRMWGLGGSKHVGV